MDDAEYLNELDSRAHKNTEGLDLGRSEEDIAEDTKNDLEKIKQEVDGLASTDTIKLESVLKRAGEINDFALSFIADDIKSKGLISAKTVDNFCVKLNKEKNKKKKTKRNTSLDDLLENMVLIKQERSVADLTLPSHLSEISLPSFDTTFANLGLVDGSTGKPVYMAWREHPKRKTAHGKRYAPNKEKLFKQDGLMWFNTFHAPKWGFTNQEDKAAFLIEFLHFLFNDSERFAFMINFIAVTVLSPEKNLQVTPLIISKTYGIGKTTVSKIIERLVGRWNCAAITMKVLADGTYHDHLNEKVLVVLNEVREAGKGKYEIDDKIRDLLTNDFLQLNLKYGKNISKNVYVNYFFSSNHDDCLIIPKGDRRMVVYSIASARRPDAYYAQLQAALNDDETIRQFYWWLVRWQESHEFNHGMIAPNTPEKEAMSYSNEKLIDQAFEALLKYPYSPVMAFAHVREWLEGYMQHAEIRDVELKALLHKHCRKANKGKQIKINRKLHPIWIIDNKYNQYLKLSSKQLREIIHNHDDSTVERISVGARIQEAEELGYEDV